MKKLLFTLAMAIGVCLGVAAESGSHDFTNQFTPNANTAGTYDIVPGIVTISLEKGTATLDPTYSGGVCLRKDNLFKMNVAAGYKLTKAEFEVTLSYGKTYMPQYNNATADGASVTPVITGDAAPFKATFEFNPGVSNLTIAPQNFMYFNTISVEYTEESTEPIHETDYTKFVVDLMTSEDNYVAPKVSSTGIVDNCANFSVENWNTTTAFKFRVTDDLGNVKWYGANDATIVNGEWFEDLATGSSDDDMSLDETADGATINFTYAVDNNRFKAAWTAVPKPIETSATFDWAKSVTVTDGVALNPTEGSNVQAVFSKGTGSNTPAFNSNCIRFYASNTLTFKGLEGAKISKIVFTTASGSYAFDATKHNVDSGTLTVNNTTATWSGDPVESVVLTNNANAQARIQKAVVTYELPAPVVPEFTELYLHGYKGRDASAANKMTTTDGVTYTFSGANLHPDMQFKIATADYSDYNFGVAESYVRVYPGDTIELTNGENSFNISLAQNTTFHGDITFNLNTGEMTLTPNGEYIPPVVSYAIKGTFNEWQEADMTKDGDVYTATIKVTGEEPAEFGIVYNLDGTQAKYYGATIDQTIMQDGTYYLDDTEDKVNFKIIPGKWNITLDLENNCIKVEAAPSSEFTFKKIASADKIKVGEMFLIGGNNADGSNAVFAGTMGTNSYLSVVSATLKDGAIEVDTEDTEYTVFTVEQGTTEEYIALKSANGYLKCTANSNAKLAYDANLTKNSNITVVVAEDDTYNLQFAETATEATPNYLRYNNSANPKRIANYANGGQQPVYLYSVVVPAQITELTWTSEKATYVLGGENNLPTLVNPANVAVNYTSSNEEVATINAEGVVTAIAEGETVIKATWIGNDEYLAAEAAYTLTVAPAGTTPDPEPSEYIVEEILWSDIIEEGVDTAAYHEYTSANGVKYISYGSASSMPYGGGVAIAENAKGLKLHSIEVVSELNYEFEVYTNDAAYTNNDITNCPGTKVADLKIAENHEYVGEDTVEYFLLSGNKSFNKFDKLIVKWVGEKEEPVTYVDIELFDMTKLGEEDTPAINPAPDSEVDFEPYPFFVNLIIDGTWNYADDGAEYVTATLQDPDTDLIYTGKMEIYNMMGYAEGEEDDEDMPELTQFMVTFDEPVVPGIYTFSIPAGVLVNADGALNNEYVYEDLFMVSPVAINLVIDGSWNDSASEYTVSFQTNVPEDEVVILYTSATEAHLAATALDSLADPTEENASTWDGTTPLVFEHAFALKAQALPKNAITGFLPSEVKTLYVPEEVATGIAVIEAENGNAAYYTLNGVLVPAKNLQPGLYIRVSNGKAAKVLVK